MRRRGWFEAGANVGGRMSRSGTESTMNHPRIADSPEASGDSNGAVRWILEFRRSTPHRDEVARSRYFRRHAEVLMTFSGDRHVGKVRRIVDFVGVFRTIGVNKSH